MLLLHHPGKTASADESIFTYSGDNTWSSISTAGAAFTPKFLDVLLADASAQLMSAVNAACGEGNAADKTCQFDALATENPDIGSATKATGEKFVETTDALGEWKDPSLTRAMLRCSNMFSLSQKCHNIEWWGGGGGQGEAFTEAPTFF